LAVNDLVIYFREKERKKSGGRKKGGGKKRGRGEGGSIGVMGQVVFGQW
jgi:hypothetical protein